MKADPTEGFYEADRILKVDADPPVVEKANPRHATSTNFTTLKRKHDQVEQSLDPKLQEYLATMKPTMRSKTWADDGILINTNGESTDSVQVVSSGNTETPSIKAKRLKPGHEPTLKTKQTERPDDITEDNSVGKKSRSFETEDEPEATSVEEAPKSDMDWLRSRTSRLLGLVQDDEDEGSPETTEVQEIEESYDSDNESARKRKAQETSPPTQNELPNSPDQNKSFDANIGQLRETGRLFVRNLLYNASESDMEPLFSPFGKIDEVRALFRYVNTLFLILCAASLHPQAPMMIIQIGTAYAMHVMLPGKRILVDASCNLSLS